MNKLLIGLTGPAGVGKDTVAYILKAIYSVETYAFAKPIKDMLKAIGITEPADRKDKELVRPEWGFSYRRAAQLLGTEWGRELNPELWLNLAKIHIKSESKRLCITDVRFENEASLIRSSGGTIWHMTGRQSSIHDANKAHQSEAGIAIHKNDHIIVNDGSLIQLRDNVIQAMNYCFHEKFEKIKADALFLSSTNSQIIASSKDDQSIKIKSSKISSAPGII